MTETKTQKRYTTKKSTYTGKIETLRRKQVRAVKYATQTKKKG